MSYSEFINSPFASWVESTFGIKRDSESGRFIRQEPKPIQGQEGAAKALSELTALDKNICAQAIQKVLSAGYACEDETTGFKVFAFRLHQFISSGDMVYVSLEDSESRYISTSGQKFVPGDRGRVLLPVVFCRECGQEYYVVAKKQVGGYYEFVARDFRETNLEDDVEAGYLYPDQDNEWTDNEEELIKKDKLPDDWLDLQAGEPRIRRIDVRTYPGPSRCCQMEAPMRMETYSGLLRPAFFLSKLWGCICAPKTKRYKQVGNT